MSKQFWAIIAGVVIVLVGVFILTSDKKESTSSSDTKSATSHINGDPTTGVKLVEYGDFQCPYCQTYHTTIKQVLADYGDQISFQYSHFPLPSLHQNAFAAHRAAEAASKQDKFWEMYDKLYENADPNGRTGWVASSSPTTFFNQFAKDIGLNESQFKTDYSSSAVNNAINADMAAGNKLGVEGTPSFFVNGKKVTIANTVDDFKKVLDDAIKKQKSGDNSGASSSGEQQQSKE